MKIPPSLQKGDKIAIVCTARSFAEDDLKSVLPVLYGWGLQPVLGTTIGLQLHQFAGSDEDRSKDFEAQLKDKNIKAILCARGGYGTVRMIDGIDFGFLEAHPKWIVGYSDVTALHSHIHTHYDTATLHATMPISFPSNSVEALESLRKALFGETLVHSFEAHPMNRNGIGEGQLIGGNLSILYSLMASPSDIDTAGKILFLEDLDEYLYHIDRMIVNLKRSGKLKGLRGLVIGGMTEMSDNTTPFGKTALDIIQEHTAEYDYPVAYGFPAGHLDDNRALVMGAKARLEVGETCRLDFVGLDK
ncbi:MAG: LD-carboxypeptidase [Chitinophagales bacterium]